MTRNTYFSNELAYLRDCRSTSIGCTGAANARCRCYLKPDPDDTLWENERRIREYLCVRAFDDTAQAGLSAWIIESVAKHGAEEANRRGHAEPYDDLVVPDGVDLGLTQRPEPYALFRTRALGSAAATSASPWKSRNQCGVFGMLS